MELTRKIFEVQVQIWSNSYEKSTFFRSKFNELKNEFIYKFFIGLSNKNISVIGSSKVIYDLSLGHDTLSGYYTVSDVTVHHPSINIIFQI